MSLSTAKWGEQMCNIFLSSLINGYETSASFEAYHSVSGEFTAHLCLIHYKPPISSAMSFLTPSAAPGRVWSESTKVTVEMPRPWFGCSMLVWPRKVTKKQVWGWSRGFLLAQNNSSSDRELTKPAQYHLLFDPPPVSEAHSGDRPCQQLKDMEWTSEEPFQTVQPVCWDLCNQHKLEQPLGMHWITPRVVPSLNQDERLLRTTFLPLHMWWT